MIMSSRFPRLPYYGTRLQRDTLVVECPSTKHPEMFNGPIPPAREGRLESLLTEKP